MTHEFWEPVTAAQMLEVDRIMTDELGVDLLQMMENAGAHLAELAIDRFAPDTVTVLAGTGGNGGGGLTAARHLANRGVAVSVALSQPPRPRTAAEHQLEIVRRMGLTTTVVDVPAEADLIIDALIGYSLDGAPTGRAADLIT